MPALRDLLDKPPALASNIDAESDDGDFHDWAATHKSTEEDPVPAPRSSRLRAEAAAADLLEDPKYAGKVVKSVKSHFNRDAELEALGFGGSDDDEDEDEEEEEAAPPPKKRTRKEEPAAKTASKANTTPSIAPVKFIRDVDEALVGLAAAETAGTALYRQRLEEDAARGEKVKIQLRFVEKHLEARVRLQKPLQSAHRLPPASVKDALCEASRPLEAAYAGAREAITGLLDDLLAARHAFYVATPDIASEASSKELARAAGPQHASSSGSEEASMAGKKRPRSQPASATSSDAYWAAISAGWGLFSAYRDKTVDTWGRRLAFAGGAAGVGSKLKVLGADLSRQVAEIMADRERVIGRTQPELAAVGVLGVGQEGLAASLPLSSTAAAGGDVAYPEAYDDSDFYTHMLREYVSAAGAEAGAALEDASGTLAAGAAAAGAGLYTGSSSAAAKRAAKDGLDRRATKGRRLKHIVHPKLVGFCAPAPYVVPPELAYDIDAIVASLFKSA